MEISQEFFMFLPMKNVISHVECLFIGQPEQQGANDKIHTFIWQGLPWQYPTSGIATAKAFNTAFILS